MKVRSAVRRICRDCYVVKKKGVVYIRCKSVKKHKQRQGFHTDAGVPAWQQQEEGRGNQRCRGFGAFACSENAPEGDSAAGSSWRPPHPLATDAPGVLASLPWLPAWASVRAPAARKETQQEVSSDLHSGLGAQSARLTAGGVSPLTTLGGWMGSWILGFMRRSGP
ncbi:unnamed protein product [Ectocarpus sp. 6 AP-2014]